MSTVVSRRTRIVSSDTPRVATALAAHPSGRVTIPFVLAVAKHAGCLAQASRSTLPADSVQDRLPHKGTAASRSGDGINLADDRIVELNVHSHVSIISTKQCDNCDAEMTDRPCAFEEPAVAIFDTRLSRQVARADLRAFRNLIGPFPRAFQSSTINGANRPGGMPCAT